MEFTGELQFIKSLEKSIKSMKNCFYFQRRGKTDQDGWRKSGFRFSKAKSEILHERKEKISACGDNPGGFSQKSKSKVSPGRESL